MGVGVWWHVGYLHPTVLLHSETEGKVVAVELMVTTVRHILA